VDHPIEMSQEFVSAKKLLSLSQEKKQQEETNTGEGEKKK